MRVLITSPVFPPDLGGPAVYVPSLGRFLVERGHEVKVVAFCSEAQPQGYPFEVVAIPRGPLPVRYLKAFWAVWREARAADVVYVNEHLALLHVLAARLRRKPCVIRIMVDGSWEIAHRKGWCGGDDIVTFQTRDYGWKVRLVRALQRRWWRWCKHIISCSDFLRDLLIEHHGVPAEKVQRIFNAYHGPRAADVPESREEARRVIGLDVDRRYVLTICRLMVWKRVDGILRALEQLPGDVHLLVAGDGDMEEEWKQLAADLGLAERAHFLGNVPHARIPLTIRAADVFVLNSEYEALRHQHGAQRTAYGRSHQRRRRQGHGRRCHRAVLDGASAAFLGGGGGASQYRPGLRDHLEPARLQRLLRGLRQGRVLRGQPRSARALLPGSCWPTTTTSRR